MFTAPTAFRAIRKEDPKGALIAGYDLSHLRYLFLAGERLDPETYHWASALLDVPVIDHWWQTETGWPIVANPAGIEVAPLKPGSPTRPLPGWEVRVLDASGKPVPAGVDGAIVVKLPLPPGALPTLWNDDDRYVASYLSAYDGYYLTGDSGHIDNDGYVFVMGRTDDIINVMRPPAVHRQHGRGPGHPPRRRRMRRHRRRRRTQGTDPARLRRSEERDRP